MKEGNLNRGVGYPSPPRMTHQNGVGMLGFLVVLMIGGILGTLALRLIPVYLNHFKLLSSLESLHHGSGPDGLNRQSLMGTLQKHWEIDSVEDVTIDDVSIEKEGESYVVQVTYDSIRPFIGNVELVVHFDDTIEVDPH